MATKVLQVDYDTLEPVEIYDSIKDAAKDNWMDPNDLAKYIRKANGMALFKNRKLAFKRVEE